MRQVIFRAMLPIVLAASIANPICAEDHEPAKNAALQYWSALVYIPDSPRLTEWEVARYDPLTTALDDAKFLMNGAGIDRVVRWSLEDLRRGARSPYCEWGLPVHETGPFTRLHHTQRAGTAAGLLILSSRVNHANGNWQAAIEDLNAAWVFALHLGSDGTLMSWGIHFSHIDRNIAPLAASWVPDIEISAVEEFEQCLRRLPAPQTLADVLRIHGEQWLDWLRRGVRKDDLESLKEQLNLLASDDDLAAAMHRETTKEEFLKWIDETSKILAEAVKIATLPLDEFQPAAASFQSDIDGANPLCRTLMGKLWTQQSVLAQKYKYAESLTRLAMFNAAIGLRRGGRNSFAHVRDPFGNGPFGYQPSDEGYTLTSGLTVDGEPFTMTFGKAAVPEVKKNPLLFVYNPDANAASEIDNGLVSARRENKRVLLQWGFNGCIPCYRLHRTMEENDGVSKVLREGFIRIPVDVTNDKNETLLKKYGIELSGVPRLTILDSDGSVLANVTPSQEFYVNGILNAQLIQGFLAKWAPNAKQGGSRDR